MAGVERRVVSRQRKGEYHRKVGRNAAFRARKIETGANYNVNRWGSHSKGRCR